MNLVDTVRKTRIEALKSEIRVLNQQLLMVERSLDSTKIALAENVIYVRGEYGPFGDDASKVRAAIDDLANGCVQLRRQVND